MVIGKEAARRIFNMRSRKGRRNSEIHVTEAELAAMIAIGALNAWNNPPETVNVPRWQSCTEDGCEQIATRGHSKAWLCSKHGEGLPHQKPIEIKET